MNQKTQYFQAFFKPIPVEGKNTPTRAGDGVKIKGYASTPTLDRYNDVVEPGAFRESIVKNYRKNPIVLFQHNPERPVGYATHMSIDDKGLYIEAQIKDYDVEEKILAGILRAFSIGYIPTKTEFQDEEGNKLDPTKDNIWAKGVKRIIKKVDLVENSIVSVPANPDALFTMEKSVKSFFKKQNPDIEIKTWEETENESRYRVRDPKDFQEDSFRRIILEKDKPRVFAIVGKLKGETTTETQSLRFPKDDDWTIAKAKEWVKDHFKSKKDLDIYNSIITKAMKKKNLLKAKADDEKTNSEDSESVEKVETSEDETETPAGETDGGEEGDETSSEGGNEEEAEKTEEETEESEETTEEAETATDKSEVEETEGEKDEEEGGEKEEVEGAGEEENAETEKQFEGFNEDERKTLEKLATPEGAIVAYKAIKALEGQIEDLKEIIKKTPAKKALAYFESSLKGTKEVKADEEKEEEEVVEDKKGFKEALKANAL